MSDQHPLLQQTPEGKGYLDRLGFDPKFSRKRVGVHEAVARWLAEIQFPIMVAGDVVGNRVLEADHILTLGRNVFSNRVSETRLNQSEPAIVGCLPDGSVVNITNSRPSQFSESVFRVSVYGVTENIALDCAMSLWSLFNTRPGFTRKVSFQCDGADSGKVELVVQSLHPLDEPAVAEQNQSRIHVSFRVFSRHSRSD